MVRPERSERRVERLVFALAFVTFAWFCQGGGWNVNARFAMVRAIVEQGQCTIDDFLIYRRPSDGTRLERVTVRYGSGMREGKTFDLAWRDPDGKLMPLAGPAASQGGDALLALEDVAASGDVAFVGEHLHPNKAPGTVWAAVPGYFVLHALERLAGVDPDERAVLVVNAWLTSVLSVGLIAALGVALFLRMALALGEGRMGHALLATAFYAFGTMTLPYATMLHEHAIVATALLASFWLVHRAKEGAANRGALALAGACAGWAAITNYTMVLAVIVLWVWVARGVRGRRAWLWFGLGIGPPFVLVCAYHAWCFGTPFTTAYAHQNPWFADARTAWLGVFHAPDPVVALELLFAPFRGLFVGAPVLLMGIVGLVILLRTRRWRGEVAVMLAIGTVLLLVNASFVGWHGGWATGPRYLAPGMPFLALPVVTALGRFPRTTCVLGIASIAMQTVFTAVDPQSPAGIAPFATAPGAVQWRQSPLLDYALPLLVQGRAMPILDVWVEKAAQWEADALPAGASDEQRAERRRTVAADLASRVRRGDPQPFPLAAFEGPVSVNPVGPYEGFPFRLFPAGSEAARWSSFNLGELLFPRSVLSLLPLLTLWLVGAVVLLRITARPAGRG